MLMFYALVVVCGMSIPTGLGKCVEITDQLGPYKTRAECVARTRVMAFAGRMHLNEVLVVGPFRVIAECTRKVDA